MFAFSLGDGIVFPQRVIDEDSHHLLGGGLRGSEDESPTHTGMTTAVMSRDVTCSEK